ncbi:MAG: amidohydrolase family protein [Candidatus Eisenbacteria bacterium]
MSRAPLARTASLAACMFGLALPVRAETPMPDAAQKLALVGGTVHTVSGATIGNGTVIVDNGRIIAVGAGLASPSDAKRIDCTGQHLYPGFVAANTQMGLIEVGTSVGSNDTQETGNVNPDLRGEVMINPDSDLLAVARVNGVTSAQVVPGGGAVHGTSALVHLGGWTQEDMVIRSPIGLHVAWPNMVPARGWFITQSEEEQNKARDAQIDAIRKAFDDARAFWKARDAEKTPGIPRHDSDVKWAAMGRALRGETPVFFEAGSIGQIRAVLKFADEQGLKRLVIVGGNDAWRMAGELRQRDVAVIVGGTLALPRRRSDSYDDAFMLPGRLAAAGVRYCISDASGPANTRNLPHHAAMAAAFGLDPLEALKAVTLYPAQILGAGDLVGSIEVGKIADLQVTDGDPLLMSTHCTLVVMGGRVIPMENRQSRLFHKYDTRPRGELARKRH